MFETTNKKQSHMSHVPLKKKITPPRHAVLQPAGGPWNFTKVLIPEDSVGLPSKDIWIAWDAPQAELLSPWHSGVGQPGLWARQKCLFFNRKTCQFHHQS